MTTLEVMEHIIRAIGTSARDEAQEIAIVALVADSPELPLLDRSTRDLALSAYRLGWLDGLSRVERVIESILTDLERTSR